MKLGGRINIFTQNPLYTLDIDIRLKNMLNTGHVPHFVILSQNYCSY